MNRRTEAWITPLFAALCGAALAAVLVFGPGGLAT